MTTPQAMPEMPAAPPPGAGSGNIEDRYADAFSGSLSSSEGTSQTPAEAAPATPSVDHAPEITEPETGEVPAEAAATEPAANEQIDPYADEDPGDQTAIEAILLKTPQGREIAAAHKFVSELAKSSAEGGIGHKPTVQDIRTYFGDHQKQVGMWQDYSSGDPQRVARFLNHWLGTDPRTGQSKSPVALQQLLPVIEQGGPDALGYVAGPILSRYENALIGKWQAASDPKMKAALYQAAQVAHNELTGEWLTPESFTNPAATAQSVVNPDQQRLQEGWQQLNQARQQQFQQGIRQWDTARGQAEERVLNGQVDAALKPLTEMKIKQPVVYEALKTAFLAEVKRAVTADPQVWSLYQQRIDAARRTGDPAAIAQIETALLNLAVPIIRAKRTEFLKGSRAVVAKNNADRHAQLREVASHVAPGNTGVAVKKSIVPSSPKRSGESDDDYRTRRISEAMA